MINKINSTEQVKLSNLKTKKLRNLFANNFKYSDANLISYPKNYYLNSLSFTGSRSSANKLIDIIGEENFPSPEIYKILKEIGDSNEYSLYEVHLNYYKDLLECKSLDEAKEKYPEFKDVKDAKDIDIEALNPNNILYKIAHNKVQGASIDNLSLELLKRCFGMFQAVTKKECYYNLSHSGTYALFNLLNIKKMSRKYISAVAGSNPETSAKKRETLLNTWKNDDGSWREKARQVASTSLQTEECRRKNKASLQAPEVKKKLSEARLRSWANDDGTRRNKASKTAREVFHSEEITKKRLAVMQTQEYKDKIGRATANYNKLHPEISEIKRSKMKEYNVKHPEYREARILAWKRHPEITSTMSNIAKDFPDLARILQKCDRNEKLYPSEKIALKIYYKKCKEAMPDYLKIIGAEYHKILVEWGIVKEKQ